MNEDFRTVLSFDSSKASTEKVLALTVEDCEDIKKVIEENGVKFVISFVHKCAGGIRTVKELINKGAVGKVNYVRFRNAHMPP